MLKVHIPKFFPSVLSFFPSVESRGERKKFFFQCLPVTLRHIAWASNEVQYSNPFPRSYLNIRPETNCGSNHDINTNVCKSHLANWQVVYQRQVPIRSLCPKDVDSKWLSLCRISIVCWIAQRLKLLLLHTEHFGEFGVRSQRKSCDIPNWDFSLQDLASAIPYFQPLWFENFFPAKFGKGIWDGSKQIHSNYFQLGLSENDVPQNHCLGTNDHNCTLILSWKMMYPNLVLPYYPNIVTRIMAAMMAIGIAIPDLPHSWGKTGSLVLAWCRTLFQS